MFTGQQQRRHEVYKLVLFAAFVITAIGFAFCVTTSPVWYWWLAAFAPIGVAFLGIWVSMKIAKDLW